MAIFEDLGAFVPTTSVYDDSVIHSLDINSENFKDFLTRLRQNINQISLVLNIKDSGFYPLDEFVNGQLFFPNSTDVNLQYRPVYRIVVNIDALPNAGVKNVAHGLDTQVKWTFTRIYGTATDTTALEYIPLPYASAVLVNNIELSVDHTNVIITTAADYSAFNKCYVVLEYITT